jgi:hypothetical protein
VEPGAASESNDEGVERPKSPRIPPAGTYGCALPTDVAGAAPQYLAESRCSREGVRASADGGAGGNHGGCAGGIGILDESHIASRA